MIDAITELIRSIAPPEIALILIAAVTAVVAYIRGQKRLASRQYLEAESGLRDLIEAEIGLPSPQTEEVDRSFIEDALQDAVPAYDGTNDPIRVIFTDGVYRAPYRSEVRDLFMISRIVQYLPYRPEVFDCENFAGLFKQLSTFFAGVNTVGDVLDWSAAHGYNVIVTVEGGVIFYEPQEDKIVDLQQEDYQLENGRIEF